MSRPPCIRIPFKKSSETDWVRPLRQYIARTLQQDPDTHNSDCQILQRLRQDMRGAKADETGRDIIFRYYCQLEALENRIQFGENGVKTGASLITDTTSEMDLESIRNAFECFRVAADRFHFINKNFMHPPLADLQQEAVNALDSIMLAQAQECALIRAQLEKKKDVTVSKLAQQAALMYSGVFDSVKSISDSYLPRGWVLLIETKLRYYQAMAQYHEARAENSKDHYGIAIARFSLAEQHAREATKLVGQFAETFFSTTNLAEDLYPESVQGLQDLIAALSANIGEELSRSNHDNDIIYNDTVPNTSTLPALEAANVAYHFDINDLYTDDVRANVVGGELFKWLIPMAVHEGSSIYSEEKAKMIRGEEDKVNLAEGELQDALTFMKLPESLRRFERYQRSGIDSVLPELSEPSETVRDAALEIQMAERANSLADMRASVEAQRVRANEELNSVRRLLDEEQRASEAALSEHASEPLFASYQPSSRAASFYREQVAENQKKLEDAAGLDNSILSDYRSVVAPWLPALQNGPDGVVSVMLEHLKEIEGSNLQSADPENLVDMSQDQPVGLAGRIQAVHEIYEQLLDIKQVRRTTLNELKAASRDDDISDALVKMSDPKGLQSLFERELHKYDNYIQRLQTAASRQGMLVKRISEEFRHLLELPQAQSISKLWERAESKKVAIESQIMDAVQVYNHVRDGLDKASRFYTMMAESLGPLRRQVSEFAASRAGLRDQLSKQIVHESASRNQAMLQERLSQYSASSHQQHMQEQVQSYQPQPAQPGYAPIQHPYQSAHSPPARAADPYDMGQLASQAAHMSLNPPSGEPTALSPQHHTHQQSYSISSSQAPQYQPSAPPPPQMSAQNSGQYIRQHQPQSPYQLAPQQPQPQPQPQQQTHIPSGHDYQTQMQGMDSGYPLNNTAPGQYNNSHVPPVDARADPYSTSVRHSAALEPNTLTDPVANSGYKPGYGGYPPSGAPMQMNSSSGGGYGGMSGPYMSSGPEMAMSNPAYAAVSHSAHQHAVYGEVPAPMARPQAAHPVTAQPQSNGYSSMMYPSASQGPNTSYSNLPMNNLSHQPQQMGPQMAMSAEAHTYKPPPRQQQQPPAQAPHNQYPPVMDNQPANSLGQYGGPSMQNQDPTQPAPANYHPPQPYQQQQPYMQGPAQYHHQQPSQQPPPPHYGTQPPLSYPPPQQHISQPAHGYSYAYSAPHYAPVSAPYGGPAMMSQPQMQSAAPQATPQYGYNPSSGYSPSPAQHQPAPGPHMQPQMQQQPPPQNEKQYQHGYGGNVGSLMD
ncbi:bck1-like resistance to osmotic shock [Coemansia brasiliensis]|uniref:BRO domain-containing protein 1 n=1 Tax=Coemansia brasiliensis TaxID=2650707 RepID=A0A9W8I7U2_9FUNG|nr:bck1-like resistance to osmotic shock [Coemansia brasiliensis]